MRWIALAALAVLALRGGVVQAQDRPTCAVDVVPRVAREIDVGALEDAIAGELGVDIVASDAPEAAMHVRLAPQGGGRIVVTLTRADGHALRRVARLDPDRGERVQTLVIVIVNLARNEADELLAMMRRRGESESDSDSDSTSDSDSDSDSDTPSPSPPPSPSPSPEPSPEPVLEAAPSPSPPPPPSPPPSPSPSPPPHDPLLRIGLAGQLGSVPDAAGNLALAWLAGLEIVWTPLPFFALGVRDLGGGYSRTSRWSVGGAVVGELAWRFADWGDLHAQLGVHAQFISADNTTVGRSDTLGIAPLIVLGARLFAVSFFSISLETALRYAATDTFHVGTELVPQGAVVWTGGLSIAFHIL